MSRRSHYNQSWFRTQYDIILIYITIIISMPDCRLRYFPPFIEWVREVWASPCSPIDHRTSPQRSCLRRACHPGPWDHDMSGSSPTLFACSPVAICRETRRRMQQQTKINAFWIKNYINFHRCNFIINFFFLIHDTITQNSSI